MPRTEASSKPFGNLDPETVMSEKYKMTLKSLSLKRDLEKALPNLPQFRSAAIALFLKLIKDRQSPIKFTIGEKVWQVETDVDSRHFSVSWELKNVHDAEELYEGQILKKKVSIANLTHGLQVEEGATIMVDLSSYPCPRSSNKQEYYRIRYLTDIPEALKEAKAMVKELRSLAPSVKKG